MARRFCPVEPPSSEKLPFNQVISRMYMCVSELAHDAGGDRIAQTNVFGLETLSSSRYLEAFRKFLESAAPPSQRGVALCIDETRCALFTTPAFFSFFLSVRQEGNGSNGTRVLRYLDTCKPFFFAIFFV